MENKRINRVMGRIFTLVTDNIITKEEFSKIENAIRKNCQPHKYLEK